MKKFLNSDWLRAVQFFRNTVQKSEIQYKKMKYSAKSENDTKSKIKVKLLILKLSISHECIIFSSILLISNSTVSRGIWKNIHT